MREELSQFLGADWGEGPPERRGYRNGTYTRHLATSSGPIEALHVPRDREGQFHTQAFKRYSRYEPQVAEGLTQMFVAGVSTEKGGEVAQTLIGVAPSKSSEESKDGWGCLFHDLRTRGVKEGDLMVTDGHDGLLAALSDLFPSTLRQRCVVHKQRTIMNAIPYREHKQIAGELAGNLESGLQGFSH